MQLLIRWGASALALFVTVLILQALNLATITARYWYSWLIAVIIMGLVNALIRPIARLITAPLNCLTFGIVGIFVNALMFWMVAAIAEAADVPVFKVTALGALLGSILVGLIGGLLNSIVTRERDE